MQIYFQNFSEENFRFICYLEKGPLANEAALIAGVSAKFGAIFALKSDQIDSEHLSAWETVNFGNLFYLFDKFIFS
jgi:hypothetical protein